MKIVLYTVIVLSVLFGLGNNSKAQTNTFPSTGSAGIGTTTPNASSILEMKSTTQGILIPRMTSAQRIAIASPATGLMVFQTNGAAGFYYYDGTQWAAVAPKGPNKFLSNLTSPTAVNVDLVPDSAGKRNLGAGTHTWNSFYFHNKWYKDSVQFLSSNNTSLFLGDDAGLKNTGQYNTSFGIESLSSNRTGRFNTAMGYYALNFDSTASENTAVGYEALYLNKTGGDNTAIGTSALLNNTGFSNTAVGSGSLYSNTTGLENVSIGYVSMNANISGYQNSAVGTYAMHSNNTGYDNVATGHETLYSNQDGSNNSALGNNALHENVSGIYNTAVGFNALYENDGFRNTALGDQALYSNSTGGFNTSIGDNAGSNVKTGSNNTFIGAGANCGTLGTLNNATAIGNGATVATDNTFILGNAAVTGWGFGVSPGARAIKVGTSASNGNGAYLTVGGAWTNASARWKKEDFQKQDKKLILEKINQLDVTKWKYKGTGNEYHYGPMADDFYRLFAVGDDSSISDMDKTGVLFLGMQQLIKMNDEKDEKINDLQKQVDELKAMIVSRNENMESRQSTMSDESSVMSGASLQQNIPNPFTHTTTINYGLPQQYSSAKIIVVDELGRTTKSINLSGSGRGSINFSSPFRAGASYQYSLYIDGKLISTKQMILSK